MYIHTSTKSKGSPSAFGYSQGWEIARADRQRQVQQKSICSVSYYAIISHLYLLRQTHTMSYTKSKVSPRS